jgi:hypothetical protein
MLAHNAGAQAALEAAIAADAEFALAHIMLARWFQIAGNLPAAQASKATALGCLDGVTRRERQHVEALAQAIDGHGPEALALIYEHLQDFPRDAFVLKQADGPFGLLGFGGSQDRLQACLRTGQGKAAVPSLQQRLARHPAARDQLWVQQAQLH